MCVVVIVMLLLFDVVALSCLYLASERLVMMCSWQSAERQRGPVLTKRRAVFPKRKKFEDFDDL
jgi:hypothetical protein